MARMCLRAVCGLLLLVGAAEATTVNPIDKVFQLMDELTAKITKDGEAELKAFKEYYEWCDDSAHDTKNSITTAKSDLEKLDATIEKAVADIEASTTNIDELAKSIATAESDLKAATEIRDKEYADFQVVESELLDGVDTLDRAIGILSKEMAKNPALLQKTVNSNNVQGLVQTLGAMIDIAAISGTDRSKILALVQNRDSDDDEETGAPAAANYKSASGGIVDILEDMKEKAEAELGDARKAEGKSKQEFMMLKNSLEGQLAQENKELDESKTAKADAEGIKGQSEGDHAETTEELNNGESALATISGDCMTGASNHEIAVKARAEELGVLAEAKKIVQEAVGGATDRAYGSFLQVSSRTDLANTAVVNAVQQLAQKQHSSALAQLASRIRAVAKYGAKNGDDVFGKIKGLISEMIAKLQKEAQEAADEKAFCDEETAKTNAKKDDLTSDIEGLNAKIDKASAASAKLKEEVATLQAELAAMAKLTQELDTARADENKAYTEAKTDLTAAIGGVQKALEVLREYYGSAALIQDSKMAALLQQPQPPAAHSKSGGAGGSIISILEVCEADFSSELAGEESKEADAAAAYDSITQENKITKSTKDQDVKYKTAEAKGLDKSVAENSGDRAKLQTELDAVLEYKSEIDSKCIKKPESYEDRKARRDAEISGLKEALEVLESETALVQKSSNLRRVSAH